VHLLFFLPERSLAMPFTSSLLTVHPDWIDYNGHLNMAYYHVLFDRTMDEMFDGIGIGKDYLAATNHSMFAAEVHVCYLRELKAGDDVRVTYRLLDADAKRLHMFAELHHATEGFLSATSEQLGLHVDMAARKVVPFPDDVQVCLAAMLAEDRALPVPEAAGRRIGIPRR
jgi:acyl-CoA thioester hydrolase